jgi:hypothetical protein
MSKRISQSIQNESQVSVESGRFMTVDFTTLLVGFVKMA